MLCADKRQLVAVAYWLELIIETVSYVQEVNLRVPTSATGGTTVMVGYLRLLEAAFN